MFDRFEIQADFSDGLDVLLIGDTADSIMSWTDTDTKAVDSAVCSGGCKSHCLFVKSDQRLG